MKDSKLLWFLAVLPLIFFVPACSHGNPPPSVIPGHVPQTPPGQASSAIPGIEVTRDTSAKADTEAAKAAALAEKLRRGLAESQNEQRSLTAELDRLRKQKGATEKELIDVYNRMVEQEKKYNVMVADLADTETTLANERQLRKQATSALVQAEQQAAAKEAEAAQLRSQLDFANKQAAEYHKSIEAGAAAASESATEADKLRGSNELKNKLLITAAGGLGISLLLNVLLIYLLVKTKLPIP